MADKTGMGLKFGIMEKYILENGKTIIDTAKELHFLKMGATLMETGLETQSMEKGSSRAS